MDLTKANMAESETHDYGIVDQAVSEMAQQTDRLYRARRAANFKTYALYGSCLVISLSIAFLIFRYALSFLPESTTRNPNYNAGQFEQIDKKFNEGIKDLDKSSLVRHEILQNQLNALKLHLQNLSEQVGQSTQRATHLMEALDEPGMLPSGLPGVKQEMESSRKQIEGQPTPGLAQEEARAHMENLESKYEDEDTGVITNYVLYKEFLFRQDGFESVKVGMQYDNSSSLLPSKQWCYLSPLAKRGGVENGIPALFQEIIFLARIVDGERLDLLEEEAEMAAPHTLPKSGISLATLREAQELCKFES